MQHHICTIVVIVENDMSDRIFKVAVVVVVVVKKAPMQCLSEYFSAQQCNATAYF